MVAIAIILLALGLPVPAGFDGMTNGQLLHALGNNWDEYFPFLISFVVIANHWAVHRKIFRYVNRLNSQVIASACLLLMSIEIARGDLLRPDAPESARHPDHTPSVAIIIAFLVSIPVSFFTGWAFALWAAIPLLVRVLRRLRRSGRRTTSSPGRPAARHGS